MLRLISHVNGHMHDGERIKGAPQNALYRLGLTTAARYE